MSSRLSVTLEAVSEAKTSHCWIARALIGELNGNHGLSLTECQKAEQKSQNIVADEAVGLGVGCIQDFASGSIILSNNHWGDVKSEELI
ncbi:hypothetical protein QQP08_000752 [Theobroma cacao]|nr:hypothetical protein QQP08_000752 [Theobroma cacao]